MVLMVVGELTVLHKYLELEALLLGGGYPQQVATLEQAYDIVREISNLCDFLSLKQIVVGLGKIWNSIFGVSRRVNIE